MERRSQAEMNSQFKSPREGLVLTFSWDRKAWVGWVPCGRKDG